MVNGPTPSEFSHGRGSRPSLALYPQPDPDFDQLAYKRALLQVDPNDPNAGVDWEGTYVGKDRFGRDLQTMEERGYTPIVRESGTGQFNDRLDPLNPKAYEDLHGRGADPNEAWRDEKKEDPTRVGWENGQYDPEVNKETAPYKHGDGENARIQNMATTFARQGKYRKVKRTPESKRGLFAKQGEMDPREYQ